MTRITTIGLLLLLLSVSSDGHCQVQTGQSSEQLLETAQAMVAAGDTSGAVTLLRLALETRPQDVRLSSSEGHRSRRVIGRPCAS